MGGREGEGVPGEPGRPRLDRPADYAPLWEILGDVPALVAVTRGPDHILTYVNALYLQSAGRSDASELLGRPARELQRGNPGDASADLADRVYTTGQPYFGREQPVQVRTASGAIQDRYFTYSLLPYRASDGRVEGLLALGVDVTEVVTARRQAEKLAAENSQLYVDAATANERAGRLLESIDDAIIALDGGWRFQYANRHVERYWGRRPDDLLGRVIWEVFPALVGTTTERELRAAAAGETRHFETRSVVSGRWVEVHISPLAGGVVAYFRDIEERKRTLARERRLAAAGATLAESLELEATLRRVAQLTVPDLADWCLVDLAEEGHAFRRVAVAYADPAKEDTARALLRRYAAMPAESTREVSLVLRTGRPEVVPEVPESMLAALAHDDEHLAALRATGIRSYLCVPLAARGHILGALTCLSTTAGRYSTADLPEVEELAARCALAIDNAQLYAAAQSAIRQRDEFLSVAAHELKTPLTALRGFSQLLARRSRQADQASAEVAAMAERVDTQAGRLARLVEQLLDVSRIEAGRLRLEPVPTDLARLTTETVASLRGRLEGRDVRIDAQPVIVSADPLRLEQILVNLLDNAVKYSPALTPIEVTVAPEPAGARVAVRDHGPGIPPDQRDKVFERFHQLDATGHVGGMGLGLYISRQIAQLHGGTLTVESPADGGSLFVLTLPSTPPGHEAT